MSDPADKSDDLIAELAKLMAASPGNAQPSVQPMARPAPLDPMAGAPASPTPIRIPGMDQPRPAAAAAAPAPQVAPRAPVTGAIRIPGMDQPAPVSTSAPVSKFDFGRPVVAAAPIKQEPLSSLAERLAPQNPYGATRVEPNLGPTPAPQAQPTPIRIPSDLKPVSENKSFAQSPSLSVAQPVPAAPPPAPSAPPAAGNNDFSFDFGFGRNPPASASPPRPTPEHDPIADLIAAEMGGGDLDADDAPEPAPQLQREARPAPAPVAPVMRTMVTPQQAPTKPTISPISSAQPRAASSAPIPLKPVSVAPRAPEADRFAISPGVGLNMKPPATQALGPAIHRAPEPAPRDTDSDPMSEIESLIGEAVRVELQAPGPVKVQVAQQRVAPHVELESEEDLEEEIGHHAEHSPAPVVPPLTTQFAPRRSGLKDDVGQSGAEDAILAAAAATGAQVDRLEPAIGDDSPYRRLKVKPAKPSLLSGGMRQYVGMAVAGTLLLAAGLGLYWVLNMGRTANVTGAAAPQLTADATPVKEAPATPAASTTETARSPVLEQMGGASTTPSAEQLVSTDETNGGPVTRDVTAEADTSESGLANRKVRTVTVRPDGTIVSGDDAVAGAEELPVERPNVPAVPATDTTNLLGDTTSVAMTDPVTDNTALTASTPAPLTTAAATELDIQPVFDPTNVAPTPITFPVRGEGTTALAFNTQPENPVNALTGAQTPNGQIDLLGTGETQPTQVAEATPEPVRASNAVAYVQLSSSPSEADANSSLRSATNRYGSLFGGSELIVVSADLGQKGTWYRVRLPASSLSEANRICGEIKSAGGDCISTNG